MTRTPSELEADRRRWWTLAVVCATIFVTSIDNTILNVALPTLVRDIHASTAELQWIVDAYLLVFAGLLLTTGSLADRIGRAKAMRIGLVVFGVASGVAAWSSSALGLTACRALMGIGAAIMVPCSMSIIVNIFDDPRERRRAIGMIMSVGGLGLGLGPMVGGLLLSQFWWGSVFLVNVPVVVVVVIAGFRLIPESKNPNPGPVDPIGVVLSIAGVSGIVYAFVEAPAEGWGSASTVGAFAGAILVLGLFFAWETRCAHPMLDVSFFAEPRFRGANSALITASFGYTGMLFVFTQLLQFVHGYSPLAAGIRLVPLSVVFITMGFISPRIAEQLGDTRVVAAGLLLFAGAMAALALMNADTAFGWLMLAMVGLGAGYGTALTPATDAMMSAVPRDKAGLASGTNNMTRQVGTAIGVAVVGSILASGYRSDLDRRVRGLGLTREALAASRRSVGSALAVARDLGGSTGRALGEAGRQAFVHGMRFGLLTAAGVLVLGSVIAIRFLPELPDAQRRLLAVRRAGTEPVPTTVTVAPAPTTES